MLGAAKTISACVALVFRRFVSTAKVLSGLVVLLRPKVPVPAPPDAPESPVTFAGTPISVRPSPTRPKPPKSDLEQRAKAIASVAKQEISEILPGWAIEIHTFYSPDIRCYEFVLRAVTPEEWGWARWTHERGYGRIVPGLPSQEWCARLPVEDRMMYMMRDKFALEQFVLRKLCEFAHDMRREAPSPPEVRPAEPYCRWG